MKATILVRWFGPEWWFNWAKKGFIFIKLSWANSSCWRGIIHIAVCVELFIIVFFNWYVCWYKISVEAISKWNLYKMVRSSWSSIRRGFKVMLTGNRWRFHQWQQSFRTKGDDKNPRSSMAYFIRTRINAINEVWIWYQATIQKRLHHRPIHNVGQLWME